MDALVYMTYLAIILVVGILCTIISNRLKIPNILLLITAGMFLGGISARTGTVAVVAFTFITLNIPGVQVVLNLTLAFVLYSIIIATVIGKSKFFIHREGARND